MLASAEHALDPPEEALLGQIDDLRVLVGRVLALLGRLIGWLSSPSQVRHGWE